MRRLAAKLSWVMFWAALALVWLWTLGALVYVPSGEWGGPAPYLFAAVSVVGLFLLPRVAVAAIASLFVVMLTWFLSLQPSNDRAWLPELSRIAAAEIDTDRARIRNVRAFEHRGDGDFTERWEERSYALDELDRLDLAVSYWDGNTAFAHTMLIFGFGEGGHLAVSVEVRREKDEGWGGLPGLYRQFEIIYVLADERDVVHVRTNVRDEDVYLYPLRLKPEEMRALFLETLRTVNALNEAPEWYDTVEHNCFSTLRQLAIAALPGRQPSDELDVVLNGDVPRLMHGQGIFATDLPFEEARRAFAVSEIARAVGDAREFSLRLRAGLPEPRY